MTILYVISVTSLAGATLSFLTLLKGVKEKGANIVVVIPDSRKEFITILEDLHIKYYVVKMEYSSFPPLKSIRDFLHFPVRCVLKVATISKAISMIEKIARNEKVDIIHTNVGPLRIGYYVSKRLCIPHIWHIREYGDLDFGIFEFPSKSYFRKLLRKDYCITITKDLLKYNKLEDAPKAKVVYNGVMSVNDIVSSKKKEKYFLCCSRISKEKGHTDVVRAFGRFYSKHPDYKLVILGYGDPSYINELKSIARKGGFLDAVEFPGFINDVRNTLSKATALIVASNAEGFGRMTAEASFCGCLVIGKNIAGTKEILSETGGYPYLTEDEMLDNMENLIHLSNEQYLSKSLYAQNKAIELFSSESYVENIWNIYKQAII